jgi:DNA-binding response OmpR family regulator
LDLKPRAAIQSGANLSRDEMAEKAAKRILIVEDDPAVSSPVKLLLTHYGFDVTVAPTLQDGQKQALSNPDLIVLDVGLPDGNGLELLEKIRLRGQSSLVYILSASTLPEMDRRIRRLVPNQHFRKPFNFFAILEAIRSELPDAKEPLH